MPSFSTARRTTTVGLCAAACAVLLTGCSKDKDAPQQEAWWTPNSVPQPRQGVPAPPAPTVQSAPPPPPPAAPSPVTVTQAPPSSPDHAPSPDNLHDHRPANAPQAPAPAPAPAPARSGNGEAFVPNIAPDQIKPAPLPRAEDIYIPLPDPNQAPPKAEDIYIPVPKWP